MSSHEFRCICQPDLIEGRPLETRDRKLKYPEGFLKIEVVPQELGVLQEHERSQTAVLLATLEGSLSLAETTQIHLQIDV